MCETFQNMHEGKRRECQKCNTEVEPQIEGDQTLRIQFGWSVNPVIGAAMHVEASFLCAQSLFWTRQKHSGKNEKKKKEIKKSINIVQGNEWVTRNKNQ